MSDDVDLERWRARLSLVRQALKKNGAPTGGGGAPETSPEKPPDARATNPPRVDPRVAPSPFTIPDRKPDGKKGPKIVFRPRGRKRETVVAPTPAVEHQKTRGECAGGDRPCPLVGCRHHTAIEVNEDSGSLQLNHPEKEPEELTASCSLDIADAGPITLEQTGAVLNLTRERVRQVETKALQKLATVLEPKFRGSCKARCAQTGMQCRLPEHGPQIQHRHERGPFIQVAAPGQTEFAEKRRVAEAASRNPYDEGGQHVTR